MTPRPLPPLFIPLRVPHSTNPHTLSHLMRWRARLVHGRRHDLVPNAAAKVFRDAPSAHLRQASANHVLPLRRRRVVFVGELVHLERVKPKVLRFFVRGWTPSKNTLLPERGHRQTGGGRGRGRGIGG